jgi:hypothetical protein
VDDIFLRSVLERVLELKSFEKKTVFTISTTAKQEDSAYLTPVRDCQDFVIAGCIMFDQKNISILLENIDGNVDVILCDSEKLIPLHTSQLSEGLNSSSSQFSEATISSIGFQLISKSFCFEFKPNDLTVNAAWIFLSQQLKFLSGKKICILGAGNIGSKLALKLVECGAEIHIYRRDFTKGTQIVNGLNLVKPESVKARIQFHTDPLLATSMADVLIGASNGYAIIDEGMIRNVKKDCLIVDLGKNNLTKSAIEFATVCSMNIYRTDIAPAIESFVYEVFRMQDILENSCGKKDLGFCNIIGGGYFGAYGDVLVDRISNPLKVLGVAQGDGMLKKVLNSIDKANIKKIINNV